jgi:flavin-dependent dehydrogenase
MAHDKIYDCAIIGGGLAGLCLAIQLASSNRRVVLFEKNSYPFHKVCGEYISLESWDFLTSLGLPLVDLNLPIIKNLGISAETGFMLNSELDLGGFGISRFTLDNMLFELAKNKGVDVIENCKVNAVQRETNFKINTTAGTYEARLVAGSYGKYTPVFVQQAADYQSSKNARGVNYIGVKYHLKASFDDSRIELHNFKNGYCGISKVDKNLYCLCYLSKASNLQRFGGDVKKMEEQVLYKNPFLKAYFTEFEFVDNKPLTISNIQFKQKQTDVNGIFLLGDAAGSITPLCGNGMSMALRASKLLFVEMQKYFEKKVDLEQLRLNYQLVWTKSFGRRIKTGFYLQRLFGKKWLTHLTLKLLSKLPRVTKQIISLTHGQKF